MQIRKMKKATKIIKKKLIKLNSENILMIIYLNFMMKLFKEN